MSEAKKSIFDAYPEEIIELLGSLGEKKFRSKQVLSWIFEHKVYDPDL